MRTSRFLLAGLALSTLALSGCGYNTLQAQALSLVARKLQASLLVEGEIGDAGLAAYGADAAGRSRLPGQRLH